MVGVRMRSACSAFHEFKKGVIMKCNRSITNPLKSNPPLSRAALSLASEMQNIQLIFDRKLADKPDTPQSHVDG